MNVTMNRMLENDLGLVEAAEKRPAKMHNRLEAGANLTAPAMMRMLAEDAGAMELCDPRNYANTVSSRETVSERIAGKIMDIRARRAARREMHARMMRAYGDARKQAV